ncbi:MAG TPA: phosphoglucomutase (alpha-D-glucose-1,6-bisphosphate-dependent) [Solirubrobacteraceae bacterium]|nr:phosphoglucomutase (alpha-D-glucose-1,6-bisphosphate-dependent) [Solirubrobacteraceae bacterium]
MSVDPRAGQLPRPEDLVDVDRLLAAYGDEAPDPSDPAQRVAFGTSGHRGSSLKRTFNEAHVIAISAAVCRYRAGQGIDGPLFLGRDTHALSTPAARTTVEVLAAHGVETVIDAADGATPTPVISHAILTHNRAGDGPRADGVVVTPSHNPPDDGGFKYNPPHGGPADTDVTGWIEREANALLESGLGDMPRIPYDEAAAGEFVRRRDYVSAYVDDLGAVIDLDAIRGAGLHLGVDPLGGASLEYWRAIAERHELDIEIVDDTLDPRFANVPLDWDGKVRMDCSSPYAMARLRELADRFDVAFANDPDADRHGIVTPSAGLLNPNHHLAACVAYLFGGDRDWGEEVGIGKTLVSSSIIDRVASSLDRRLVEVPVGFKWFVEGLIDGTLGFGGEESAGASFLRRDGTPWSTDKDGLIPCLLAAEMKAVTGRDPGEVYRGLTERFGEAAYTRIDVAASAEEKDVLKRLDRDQVSSDELAGEPIEAVLTEAPGNGAPIGGVKVVAEHGWFAARPSGTEDVYKVYAESLRGAEHLAQIVEEAQRIVHDALQRAHA